MNELRRALLITGRELGELWNETTMTIVAVLFTFVFPAYLAWVVGATNTTPERTMVWALDSAMMPIFPASILMIYTFITERDQGILPTLLATPISSLALFWGKALPIITLGATQSLGAYAIFFVALAIRRHSLAFGLDGFALAMLPMLALSASVLTCGVGIVIASRIRAARDASLALTFSSLVILSIQFALATWLLLDPIGRRMAVDTILGQAALGAATMMVAANTYRREEIVAQL
jgi:ABC-type transport system involved in multi-copper enzyme maturation permease subunit